MNGRMRAAFEVLSRAPLHRTGQRALQIAIGAMICFRLVTEWPVIDYLLGPHGIASVEQPATWFARVAARMFSTDLSARATLVLEGGLATCLVVGVSTRITTILLLAVVKVIQARQPWILDGGDNVVAVALLHMCLLLPAGPAPTRTRLTVWLHNLGIVGLIAQTCIIYVAAGFYKMQGSLWTNGTAPYAISQVDVFSIPVSRSLFMNHWATTVGCYVTMFYQVWFPIAVFTKLRHVWIATGTLFHVGIAVMMGLVPFSIVMIDLDWLALTDKEFAVVAQYLGRIRQRAATIWLSKAREG